MVKSFLERKRRINQMMSLTPKIFRANYHKVTSALQIFKVVLKQRERMKLMILVTVLTYVLIPTQFMTEIWQFT